MRQGMTEENLYKFEPIWLEQAMIFIERLVSGNGKADSEWSEPKDVAHHGNSNSSLELQLVRASND